jgi:hypothetical protein
MDSVLNERNLDPGEIASATDKYATLHIFNIFNGAGGFSLIHTDLKKQLGRLRRKKTMIFAFFAALYFSEMGTFVQNVH